MASVTQDRRFGVNSGKAVKVACKVASTANLTLSGEQTIDGVACVTDDRVLVKDQTDGTENAIWIVDTGAWSRASDFNDIYDITQGTLIGINQGSTNANKYFKITTTGDITPGTTSIAFSQAIINDAASIGYEPAGTGSTSSDVQTKLRESVSLADFSGIDSTGVTDSAAGIQAAVDHMESLGGGVIYCAEGTYRIDTTIQITDSPIYFEGAGMGVTIFKAGAAIDDVFLFDTATVASGDRVPNGGMYRLDVDGNDLAKRCIKTVSTNYGQFDFLRLVGATEDQFLATTGSGQPSSQHNFYGTLEIFASNNSNGFQGTGLIAAGTPGNWSLNYMQNIYVLLASATGTGDGVIFGYSDGNYASHIRCFRTAGHTGKAVIFEGDSLGTVTGGSHARHNCIGHLQTGAAGMTAESGTSFDSISTVLNYSRGNGSPDPTVETGASLGWSTLYMGRRGTFTPTLYGTTTAGTPTYVTQDARYEIEGSRCHFDIDVEISAIGGMVGNIRVGGLPFTMSNDTGVANHASCHMASFDTALTANYYVATGWVQQGGDYIALIQNGPGQTPATITAGVISATAHFRISGSYPVEQA
jgi:hypothetical protein